MQTLRPISFGKWMSVCSAVGGIYALIIVGLAGLVLNLPLLKLLVPFVMLFFSGLVLGLFLFWARQAYDRPKSCAIRCALAIFFYVDTFGFALLFSALHVGILSKSSALNDYAPYILPTSMIGGVVVYFTARKNLEATQHGGSVPY